MSIMQPLSSNVPIVDDEGKPTSYFTRLMQKMSVDITNTYLSVKADPGWVNKNGVMASAPVGALTIGDNTIENTVTIGKGNGTNQTGFIEWDQKGFAGGLWFGFAVTAGNRLPFTAYGSITGVEFSQDVYVTTNKVYHAGNLSFGTGLTYNSGTGVLTASGGGSTPAIRGTGLTTFNAATVTIAFPTGTVAGDLAVLWTGHGWNAVDPAGGTWTRLDLQSGTGFNGATWTKLLTASDISTGSVTVTYGGSYFGVIAIATLYNTNKYRGIVAARSGTGVTSLAITSTLFSKQDLVLAFISNRATTTDSLSNSTLLRQGNNADATGYLGQYTANPVLSLTETATFGLAGSGYYTSLVGIG